MHNNFLDKKRRNIRLQTSQVELVLPEHFGAAYPKFVSLLKFYYEFQGEEKATELLAHLFAARDITETDIQLLSFIEDELLLGDAYFESFATGDAQKRAAANFSNTLFRSKGTTFAIQWFFRSFFNIDVEVVETKNNVFNVGDPQSRVGPNSLRFLTDDKLYQTFAYLIRSSIPFSKWGELFKLFVHPAGMYLGAELLVSDEKLLQLSTSDSDSNLATAVSPVYTLTNVTPSVTEGNEQAYFLSRSDGVGTDDHTWYINLQPEDGLPNIPLPRMDSADFLQFNGLTFNNADSDFPTKAYPRPIIIPSGVGSGALRIRFRVDSDETEGSENFQVVFQDGEGRVIATSTPSISDRIASYSINEDVTTIDEGESVTFTVSGTGVPNGGNTQLKYTVNPITADSDDFVSSSLPDVGGFLPLAISSTSSNPITGTTGSGQFTVQTRVDGLVGEGAETFNVNVYTESGTLKATSSTITVNNVTPRFEYGSPTAPDGVFSSSPGEGDILVTEGDFITVRLKVDPTTVGEQVYYQIDDNDDRITTRTGLFTITDSDAIYTLSATNVTDTYDSVSTTYFLRTLSVVDSGGFFTPVLGNNSQLLQLGSQPPTFNVSVDQAGLTEGDTVVFTVNGTNIEDGNSAKYYINHGTTDDADFSVAPPTSVGAALSLSFTNDSAAQGFTFATNTDGDDTANESFTFVVLDNDDNEVASLGYTILGNNIYSLTTPTTQDEGGSVLSTFATDDADGDYYYWIEGVVDSDDFSSGWADNNARQSFTVSGGTADITVEISEDKRREGTETFKILAATDETSGAVAQTGDITVNDTSLPAYSLFMANETEGSTLSAVLSGSIDNSTTEDIYLTFQTTSGDSVTFGDATPLPQTFTGGVDTFKTFTTTTSVDDSANGNRTVTAIASINNYIYSGGTQVASTTATVSDATPSYTLITNKTNDSANEGDTIQFTFGGTNVPTGNYYYRLSDIVKATATDTPGGTESITSGSDAIRFGAFNSSTSQISVGDEVRGEDVETAFTDSAAVTLVFDTSTASSYDYVQMDENATATVSGSHSVYFAAPEVWEDFSDAGVGGKTTNNAPYGFFFHTTATTTTFNVDISDTDDVADPATTTYTMQVFDDAGTTNLLKSRQFTIYDGDENPTPNVQIGLLTDPDSFQSTIRNDDAECEIRFDSDGSIRAGIETIIAPFQYFAQGNWVDDTGVNFTNSEFEIKATKASESIDNGSVSGSFGTWQTLDQDRSWSAISFLPGTGDATTTVEIDFIIREIANPSTNVATVTVSLGAIAIDYEGRG